MGPPSGPPPTLSRAERAKAFALDAPDVILFRGCSPGGTFKCRFTLLNVDVKAGRTVELSWGAPAGRSARLFHIDYPLPVKLRPGCSHSVDVVFKAGAHYREEAHMDFTTQDGSFRVPLLTQEAQLTLEVRAAVRLRACADDSAVRDLSASTTQRTVLTLALTAHAQAPPGVVFGTVAVADSLTRTFPLRNAGEAAVHFAWSTAPPFTITPPLGDLQPGETATMTATFAPTHALVHDVKARARLARLRRLHSSPDPAPSSPHRRCALSALTRRPCA